MHIYDICGRALGSMVGVPRFAGIYGSESDVDITCLCNIYLGHVRIQRSKRKGAQFISIILDILYFGFI